MKKKMNFMENVDVNQNKARSFLESDESREKFRKDSKGPGNDFSKMFENTNIVPIEEFEISNPDSTKGCEYCDLKSLPGHGDYKFGREFDTEYQASVCIRSYKDDHFVLLYEDEETDNEIPIKFCPICGKKL